MGVRCCKRGLKLGKASKEFGVPKQTLSDRILNKWKATKPGSRTELSDDE